MNRLEQAQKLGEILRTLIHDRGWSVLDTAKRAKINPSTFNGYVNGIVFPTAKDNRDRLARLLSISPEEFDAMFGLAPAAPTRSVDELCRDVRLLSDEDFAVVAEVVLNRIVVGMKSSSSSPTSRQ